jgi:hypothetical protein
MYYDKIVGAMTPQTWPYIIEERQLNISQLDVFSRLMDGELFSGTGIDDQIANIVQAIVVSWSMLQKIFRFISTPEEVFMQD